MNVRQLAENNGDVGLCNARVSVEGADRILHAHFTNAACFGFNPLQMQTHPHGGIKTPVDEARHQHAQTDISDDPLNNQRCMRPQCRRFVLGVLITASISRFHLRQQRIGNVPAGHLRVRQWHGLTDIAKALLAEQICHLVAQQFETGQSIEWRKIGAAVENAQRVEQLLLCLRHISERNDLEPILARSRVKEKQRTGLGNRRSGNRH